MSNNSKHRICYLINCLSFGGAQTVLSGLLEKLDRDSFEPVLISIKPDGPLKERFERLKVPVYSLNVRYKYDIAMCWRLFSLLKQLRPDILHSQLFHADLLARVIGPLSCKPIVLSTIHNISMGSKFRERLLGWTDQWADYKTIISQRAAELMVAKKAISKDNLQVIYNGIDDSKYLLDKGEVRERILAELGLNKDKKIYLSIGRLEKAKAFHILLDAVSHIKGDDDWHLLIIGEGSLDRQLKNRASKLNLRDRLTFLGRRNDIAELLSASEFFVLSSLWEGLPMVIEEAMAAALPVVATDVGGVSELIDNGKNGFLIEAGDSKLLAKAIEKMRGLSPLLREEMGSRGRDKVKSSFSLTKMTEEYQDLYLSLIEGSG